jgi:hypothetical protein
MNQRRKIKATNGATHNRARGSEPDVQPGGQSQNSFIPRTELGRRLLRIRRKILASGQPLLHWNNIESELRDRRGEANEETRN